MHRRWLVLTAAMLVAAACGGDDGSDDASPSSSTTSVTTSSARPDPLGADELPASGPIAAGSYVATEMTPPLRLDIPAGWEASMAETRRFTLTSGDASVTLIQRNELVDELLEMMTGADGLPAGAVSDATLSRVPAKRFDAVSPGVEILDGDHEVPAGAKVRVTIADLGAGRLVAIVQAPPSSFDAAESDAAAILDTIAFA